MYIYIYLYTHKYLFIGRSDASPASTFLYYQWYRAKFNTPPKYPSVMVWAAFDILEKVFIHIYMYFISLWYLNMCTFDVYMYIYIFDFITPPKYPSVMVWAAFDILEKVTICIYICRYLLNV
jgi:hypothetical protein